MRRHDELWLVCKKLPEDYEPYGQEAERRMDCSCGCRWYHVVAGAEGADWGVCFSPKSHRSGLLTFEHQGCHHFEQEDDDEPLTPEEEAELAEAYEDIAAGRTITMAEMRHRLGLL
jgi:hypothetical protein